MHIQLYKKFFFWNQQGRVPNGQGVPGLPNSGMDVCSGLDSTLNGGVLVRLALVYKR